MPTIRTRRLVALISGAALLASLAAATVAAPSAAAEKVTCRGKVATIVGTQGPDVLVGTNGRDIIAGLGGNDVIKGLGGHDLICAGRGADRVEGNQGPDRIYGNAGPDKLFGGKGPDKLFGGVSDDLLKGQKGGDALDGGPGTDTCYQNQGTGSETSCELPAAPVVVPPPVVQPPPPEPVLADLEVTVTGPDSILYESYIVYNVTVSNSGPADTAYDLSHAWTWDYGPYGPACYVAAAPSGSKPVLAAGDSQAFEYRILCYGTPGGLRLTAEVAPTGGVSDPDLTDNSDSHLTNIS